MARKKRKKKKNNIGKPLKIEILEYGGDHNGILRDINYACNGVLKCVRVSYLRMDVNATVWEIKHIVKWIEKYHPDRAYINHHLYDYLQYRYEYLGLDPETDDWVPDSHIR